MRNFLLICFLLIASASFAVIVVSEPQDELTTFDKVVMLRGSTDKLQNVRINNQPIKVGADGSFSCGLVLSYGKNLAEVRVTDGKRLRLLRLKSYPDMENLYEGKKHWAWDAVVNLSTLGYIEGYPDDNFYPFYSITRGEFATWLARVKEMKKAYLDADVFMDVPKEHWRASYIKAVVDAGYMRGYPNGMFGLDDPVTRWEAAEIAVASEGLEIVEKIKPIFVDVPKEERGAAEIYTAQEKGLVRGIYKQIPIYMPEKVLTRAEAAALFSRFKLGLEKMASLFDFKKGYSAGSLCQVNVRPQIESFTVAPREVAAGQKTTVLLQARVAPREGFSPISKVKVDLSAADGMPDLEMSADEAAADGQVYSTSVTLEPSQTGEKTLTVTVTDWLGWEAKQETKLLVLEK